MPDSTVKCRHNRVNRSQHAHYGSVEGCKSRVSQRSTGIHGCRNTPSCWHSERPGCCTRIYPTRLGAACHTWSRSHLCAASGRKFPTRYITTIIHLSVPMTSKKRHDGTGKRSSRTGEVQRCGRMGVSQQCPAHRRVVRLRYSRAAFPVATPAARTRCSLAFIPVVIRPRPTGSDMYDKCVA